MNIWDFERKILNSVPLSSEEMRVVEETLLSARTNDNILACEALLRLGDTDQKNRALRTLSRIVENANSGEGELEPNLVMTFLYLPLSVLSQSSFRESLTRSTTHIDDGVRVNSMVVLGRLAKTGAKWAIELLETGSKDPSDLVRQNATAGLSLASEFPGPEE